MASTSARLTSAKISLFLLKIVDILSYPPFLYSFFVFFVHLFIDLLSFLRFLNSISNHFFVFFNNLFENQFFETFSAFIKIVQQALCQKLKHVFVGRSHAGRRIRKDRLPPVLFPPSNFLNMPSETQKRFFSRTLFFHIIHIFPN